MTKALRIRDTGISVLDVLELIAQGRSYDSILNRHPQLSFFDIGHAARVARDIIIRFQKSRLPLIEPLNNDITQGRGWTEDESRELRNLYRSGATESGMARIFLRSETEIRNHLTEMSKGQS